MTYYTTIDHTADLGIRVQGTDPRELYGRSAFAMFDLITDARCLEADREYRISVNGTDWPDLMVNWLRELLFLWSGNEMLVQDINIRLIEPYNVSADVRCTHFKPQRHNIRHDIKAVTYHQIEVTQQQEGWTATIIFDV